MKRRNKLSCEERFTIESMLSKDCKQIEIAKKLKRSRSTISKEIRANSSSNGYVAHYASMLSRQRQSVGKRNPRKMTPRFKKKLKALLKKDYSPEQISGLLHAQGITISHETIYQWIWANKQQRGKLYLYLRRKGRCYRKRGTLYQNPPLSG